MSDSELTGKGFRAEGVLSRFDDILLLGKGGSTVYLGPSKRALEYFTSLGFKCGEHVNPADV